MQPDQADLIYGVPAIAAYLGLTPAKIYHLQEGGELPTFKLGRRVCARRSTLATFFAEQELAGQRGTIGGKTVIVGLRAISEFLGVSVVAAGRLNQAKALPTYLDARNRISAKVAELTTFRQNREAANGER